MVLLDWQQKVRVAADQQELLGLAREYLASWYHGDLAQIPEECRPPRIKGVDDLHYWSARLAESFCTAAAHEGHIGRPREMRAFCREPAERARVVPPDSASNELDFGTLANTGRK